MTTYSTDLDVSEKYSHIKIPSGVLVSSYRESAYYEINSKLRKIYTVPIDSTDVIDLGILKSTESSLVAGRVLTAITLDGEMDTVHEYGIFLINEGKRLLKELIEGDIVLEEATRATDDDKDLIGAPIIQGKAADDYGTFDRPMSGIENDAIEGKVNSEEYNSLEDTKQI